MSSCTPSVQILHHSFHRAVGGNDTVVQADAAIGVTGKYKSGAGGFRCIQGIEACFVTEGVLRDTARMPVQTGKFRRAGDSEQRFQFATHKVYGRFIGKEIGVRVGRAAQHNAQEYGTPGRLEGKQGRRPDAAEQAQVLPSRHQEPEAVQVMAEAGVDISGHQPKHLDELTGEFDYVVTVCDSADVACPTLPARVKRLHAGFDDPPRLAELMTTEADRLRIYRRVRDEIRAFVERLPEQLEQAP